MLTLIAGRAGSGKTEYCVNRALELAKAGARVFIVVPEQSSYACERMLTAQSGGEWLARVSVSSFRKLCEAVFESAGGGARRRLSEAQKHLLVRRALDDMGEDVRFFRRMRRDHAFFALAANAADELKNAGVTPERLLEAAKSAATENSRAKLSELAELYRRYDALLEGTGRDAQSELNAAAERCEASGAFADAAVIFDGFSGFTEPELGLIAALLRCCDVYCSLCCDSLSSGCEIFEVERSTARRLCELAREAGAGDSETVFLSSSPRFRAAGLADTALSLAGLPNESSREGVYSFAGDDLYDEVERAAAEISFLVRERAYRFSEICVITRDLAGYRAPLERTFSRFEIPFFTDEVDNLLHTSAVVFILAALGLARSLRSEGVLALLKTGLCGIDAERIAQLEDYVFVRGVEGGGWYEPFTGNPFGFGEPDEVGRAALAAAESVRSQVMFSLAPFLAAAKDARGAALVREIYSLMERCGALKILEDGTEELAREGSAALRLLEQLHESALDESFSAVELSELMRTLAAAEPLSRIPPSLEQVQICSADRSRPDSPRAVFVLGLNDGLFPLVSFDSPLLTQGERELLAQSGVRLGRDIERCEEMERVYLYRALTSASERLYLSYAKRGAGGALEPSAELAAIIGEAQPCAPESDGAACAKAVNARTALREYLKALERGDGEAAALLAFSLPESDVAAARAAALAPRYKIDDPALPRAVIGETAALSATRIEAFSQCRFAYFLKYMLKIKPLRRAELNPLEAGSFIHAVMESVTKELGSSLADAGDGELFASSDRAADEYILSRVGEAQLAANARLRYLVRRLKEQSRRLLIMLRSEQRQSEFRIADSELKIARGGEIEPLELVAEGGERVYVEGSVDRVDIFKKDDVSFIRVVDYKTGTKAFSLSDVYYGLNMQMLLYLFSICENGKSRYGETAPAAVMYLPGDPSAPAASDDIETAARRAYRMDGLVLDDPEVIRALEREAKGVFIPVELTADGTPKKSDKLASLERLGNIRRHVERTVVDIASALYAGEIGARPVVHDGRAYCEWCDYAAVCRRDRTDERRETARLGSGLFEEDVDVENTDGEVIE